MYRKGGGAKQRLIPLNGDHNGGPPPSTIAAQIVHNASTIKGQNDPGTKRPLSPELIKEFLQNQSLDEPDADVIALVTVITEGGVDALFREDPFALEYLKVLGFLSIAALKIIFQAKPHLLLSLRGDEDTGNAPPVFIWLFSKLVGLLGQGNLQTIHDSVLDLLRIFLDVFSRSTSGLRQAKRFLELYGSCIDDINSSLEAAEEMLPPTFKVTLPSSSSMSEIWPDSQHLVALPHSLQRTITSPIHAIYVGFRLLQAILHSDLCSRRPVTSKHEHLRPWTLDSCFALWSNLKRWASTAGGSPLRDEIDTMYFQLLEGIALPDFKAQDDFSISPKAILSFSSGLVDLIQTCLATPVSEANQIRIASLLTRLRTIIEDISDESCVLDSRLRLMKSYYMDYIRSSISEFCQDVPKLISLHRDLQLALCLWTCPGDWPPEVEEMRNTLCSDGPQSFASDELNQESFAIVNTFRDMNILHEERPAKRRKTLPDTEEGGPLDGYSQLIMALNGSPQESPVLHLQNLQSIIQDRYVHISEDPTESEEEQCELLLAFGKIACAASQCLRPGQLNKDHWKVCTCKLCDSSDTPRHDPLIYWDLVDSDAAWKDVIAALLAITQEEKFQNSSKPRVLMAIAIGRVFTHISDPEYLNLEICALGEWLLKSMTRSLRELRIVASQALMTFLREDIARSTRDKNRRYTMQFLAELAKRNVLSEQETLIMAYGQAARICSEVELPIILNQLVEYLGHTNPLIYGMAYNELSSLADDFRTSPLELLRPYWRSIGFSVMKDLQNKPQKAQLVSDLIELSVTQLLSSTHGDVLPHLVLTKRKDVLLRIAKAKSTSIEDICSQPRKNLAGILALLLCQRGEEVEKSAMETLTAVAPGFRQAGQELDRLVQQEPVFTACEVLKLAADQDERNRQPFHLGFHRLAALSEMKDGQRRSTSKKRIMELFLQNHILGIMAHFSDVIENPSGGHPLCERKRCVGAIGEMVALAGKNASFALPQLRACLQSAMADAHLCDQAFDVWSALLAVLDEEDLELVVDQTFALVVHNWPSFSDETRLKTNNTLDTLRQRYNALLQARIGFIPSLASIPMMAKLEGEIARLKAKVDKVTFFNIFSERCKDENAVVVRQALKELIPFLEENQALLHQSANTQKPLPALTALTRSLLDACVRFNENNGDIPILCAQCLGLIGGLDPYRVETLRQKKQILVLNNFKVAAEVIDFATFMLEDILIKVFLSTTNAKSQGFLAYVMQELLKSCGFSNNVVAQRPRASQSGSTLQRWNEMPESVRSTLTPFLNSKYMISIRGVEHSGLQQYPIFNLEISHSTWLRTFAYDLLYKTQEENAKIVFRILARVIRNHDLSIASFILPFAVLNVIVGGEEQNIWNVGQELLTVLETEVQGADQIDGTNIKQCSENVFQTLDYLALWLQEKRRAVSEARIMAGKTGRGISEIDELEAIQQISSVEQVLQMIPAKVISKRAVECGSYARALFHWEEYYREEQSRAETIDGIFEKNELLQHLQFIYAQMDEPDSIEGISAHLQVLNPEQQIMEHRKAGRWTAAQSWYELALAEKPNDPETQINLLTCLKESGQYDSILNYVDGFHASNSVSASTLPFAAEAAWSTGKWDQLEQLLASPSEKQGSTSLDFNVGIGKALLALRRKDEDDFKQIIECLRRALVKGLSPTATASLSACHDHLVKLHTLYEIEAVSGMSAYATANREFILENLDRRLDILGAYTSDKQYLLGVRRATMQLSRIEFTNFDVASAWLTTARLARKGEFTSAAFNSILHATKLGDDASKIEYSKMLWKEGHHRKAIQNLRGAIMSNSFQTGDSMPMEVSVNTTITMDQPKAPNRVKCHAQLLLAKWLDRASQTKATSVKEAYAAGIMSFPRWDKGHYYLGRYYLKLYESEKQLPAAKRSDTFYAGEMEKLVIENYTRSTVYGTKHYYQTIPKVLTLWLDMGMETINNQPRTARDKELHDHKLAHLEHVNKYIKRYATERMPAFSWYTAFPQIITRISHPNKSVWEVLQLIILRVAGQYPQQALWSLLAVIHSTQDDRRIRGTSVLQKLRAHAKPKNGAQDLKSLIMHGQRLTDALLAACDAPIEQRVAHVSLSRDLGFNHKLAPCALVVPIEATMIPNLPSGNDSRLIRAHNPFPQENITISAFMDDVLVLSSLQRPRKVNVRGSDGRSYGLLCKPKDDLRKDQRLMEFNAMINRALQRDIESSKRRLYIKTYGVTPLNEECGTIEWVEGLKPMRDIIIRLYRQKNIVIDYAEIRMLLNEACSDPSKTPIFTHKILGKFPPVLHEWFVETFPEPEAWFAARLRYTRSCAVMSIVGHVLGLGDRHGENVLLEEGNGGTFHVDFNCLFDKGLTFEKPELVPFRLTHNMVDSMGPQGIEGPFRKAAELTYSLLRQHEDTLITILETFVHDPTADFLGGKRKKKIPGVPETPQEVLEIVRQKVAGLIRGESVPLSVEGYVDSLIQQARDARHLASMYIGWCAFF